MDNFRFALQSELMNRPCRYSQLVIACLFVLSGVSGVPAQSYTSTQPLDMPSEEFGGTYMHMLLEKTFLKLDALILEIWLGGEEAERITELVAEGVQSRDVEDAIADAAIHSRDAYVRLVFVRDNISLDQFVDGARKDLERASKAGIVSKEHVEQVVANLPVWYSFLDERTIRKGDRMHYRVHGDTLHSQYVGVDGEIFLDQRDTGESPRLAAMGSYFVRGSSFREKLIKSLFVE
jgi:hypothetical protein